MPTRNLSVMFTDIKGFTQRTSASTREAIKRMMDNHAKLLIPVFHYFDGTIVKTIGDAYLVHFTSPTDAVLCGVTIQEVLRQHNKNLDSNQRLDVRVAINVGDVELMDGDIMGEPVNIAARLEGIAEAGQVYFTEAVYQTMNRLEAPSAEVGEHIFKGIPHPIRVYKVIDDEGSDLAKRLSECVSLSKNGPVIDGIRTRLVKQKTIPPISKYIAIAAVLVITIVIGLLLLPSERDKHLADAQSLAAQNDYINALSLIDPDLRTDPTDAELRQVAITFARSYIDSLVHQGLPDVALEWLTTTIKNSLYLEPLRPQIAVLDARVVVKENPWTNNYVPFYDLAERNPKDTEGLYTAARLLEKNSANSYMTIWLYDKVIERGAYQNDKAIFDFCLKIFKTTQNHNSLIRAHRIIENSFSQQAIEWASKAVLDGSAAEVMHAFITLNALKHPLSTDPYAISLNNLIQGKELDNCLEVFANQKDASRRKHIIALHQEVIDKYPRFFNYGNIRDSIKSNKEILLSKWAS